jgi:hypothetical protein
MAGPLGAAAAPPGAAGGGSSGGRGEGAQETAGAGGGGLAGDAQAVIDALQLVKVTLPHVAPPLLPPALAALLPPLAAACTHGHGAVRAAAARCAAALAAAAPAAALPPLLRLLLPQLDGSRPAAARLGVVETVGAVASALGTALVPYVVLLVVPLLRRMSDPHAGVRRGAALCFGRLVALLPLAQVGAPAPGEGCLPPRPAESTACPVDFPASSTPQLPCLLGSIRPTSPTHLNHPPPPPQRTCPSPRASTRRSAPPPRRTGSSCCSCWTTGGWETTRCPSTSRWKGGGCGAAAGWVGRTAVGMGVLSGQQEGSEQALAQKPAGL